MRQPADEHGNGRHDPAAGPVTEVLEEAGCTGR